MTSAHHTLYTFFMPYLLLLVLLAACTATEAPALETLTYEAPAPVDEAPAFDLNPWIAGDMPFKIYLGGAISEDKAAARQAFVAINNVAGAVFVETLTPEDAQVTLEYLAAEGRYAQAVGASDTRPASVNMDPANMIDGRRTGRGQAIFMHEFLHLLGYYSETGDVHDAEGSLMSESIELPFMYLGERHRQYITDFVQNY